MSKFYSVFYRNGSQVNQDKLLIKRENQSDIHDDISNDIIINNIAMGGSISFNTPWSVHEQIPFAKENNIIVANARIDNRKQLFELLNIAPNTEISDSELILDAYQRWGENCIEQLDGDFSFAIWDKLRQELFVGRDAIGVKSLFYYISTDLFICSSELSFVKQLLPVIPQINEDWIAFSLSNTKTPTDITYYKDILRLPPAHFMKISSSQLKIRQYWDLDVNKTISFKNQNEYIDAFREKLNDAVRKRTISLYNVGSELSGGLDSSMVASYANRHLNQQLHAFGNVLNPLFKHQFPYSDERVYMDKLVRFANISNVHYIDDGGRDIIQSFSTSNQYLQHPSEEAFHLFTDELIEKASSQGVRTMLSGYGGDELISSHVPGYLYHQAHLHQWQSVWQVLTSKYGTKVATQKMIALFANEQFPLLTQKIKSLLRYHPENIKDIDHCMSQSFLNSVDFSKIVAERAYVLPGKTVNEQQRELFHRNYRCLRLENTGSLASKYQMEYRYPLLDKSLIEFYLSLPVEMKYKHPWGRYIFRLSADGVLPEDIRWRNDKAGFVIPSMFVRLNRDLPNIQAFIESKKENLHPYIDFEQLEKYVSMMNDYEMNKKNIRPSLFFNTLSLLLFD